MTPGELSQRALDTLDVAILVLSSGLDRVLYRNARARELVPEMIPDALQDAVEAFVRSRQDARRSPPALRIALGDHSFFVRVALSAGKPNFEIVVLREHVVRDVDAYQLLSSRYGISRREYQVLTAVRLGKRNTEIASELGIARGTVQRHLHRLLQRFEAKNRTELANLIEHVLAKRG